MRPVLHRLTAGLVALAVTTAGLAPSASAAARSPRTGDSLGVVTAFAQAGATVTTSFFFSGLEATGFVLAVPHSATLSTLSPTRLARDFSLTTLNGARVHYVLLAARPDYLSITLHAPQPDLRLSFTRSIFRFSASAERQIAAHALRTVKMGIAFSGAPGQLVASKFSFAP
jgi:hypothetical protein